MISADFSVAILKYSPPKMIERLLFTALFSTIVAIESNIVISRPLVDYVQEARRLVHQSDWAAVATISSNEQAKEIPMINVISTSDSKRGSLSTGNIYFCMRNGDLPTLDVARENKITFLFSDAQGGECNRRLTSPCGRKCARTSISGQVRKLLKSSAEYLEGFEAFISRHPNLPCRNGTEGLEYYLYTLDIQKILVLSGPGGYKSVSLEDYFGYLDEPGAT